MTLTFLYTSYPWLMMTCNSTFVLRNFEKVWCLRQLQLHIFNMVDAGTTQGTGQEDASEGFTSHYTVSASEDSTGNGSVEKKGVSGNRTVSTS